MDIQEALLSIPKNKRFYFNYKFPDTRYDQTLQPKTEEEFLISVNKKTMNGFLQWEKTAEYRQLVELYLASKVANDMIELYEKIKDKAFEGDEKNVKLYLQMSKDLTSKATKFNSTKKTTDIEDDGLSL